MDYTQAVQFHKAITANGSILGLDSIRALMQELGDIWKELKIVHIAGTNGKGSVCCFLASVFKEAGYRVGQFNSPAVFHPREVYQINGSWISEEEYAECMEEAAAAYDRICSKGMRPPTVFEVETAVAFLWFYRKKCEIVLLETGMGGSTDATNLIQKPLCSVVVSVSMDHMAYLGNSLAEIAKVKAGIIKENCPVVLAGQQEEAEAVLVKRAEELHAPCFFAEEFMDCRMINGILHCCHPEFGMLKVAMQGIYQAKNLAAAVRTIQVLKRSGYMISKEQVQKGIASARWPGRFACICKSPLFYIDGAHNADGAEKLRESLLAYFPKKRRIGIMGVMADKPYREMLKSLLPLFEKIYTVTPENKRAMPAELLAEEIRMQGGSFVIADTVSEAVRSASKEAERLGEEGMVMAFGSLYYLGEVERAMLEA